MRMFELFSEDAFQAMQMARQAMSVPQSGVIGGTKVAGKIAADALTGGMAGNVIDAANFVKSLFTSKQKETTAAQTKLARLEAEAAGMKLPPGGITVDPGIFKSLSTDAFALVMTKTLYALRAGKTNDPGLFNRLAKDYVREVFGSVR